MSSWVITVLIAFGKALLISLSILLGSCCLRYLYRLWIRKMGCSDGSDDLSESCKYEMELQSGQELNHMTPSHPALDALSEIELPPSPGANTSCPPYNTNSLFPDKPRSDDYSDSLSGVWRHNPISEGGETTDAELTSFAGETTTVCSVLTGNEEHYETESPCLPRAPSPPLPRLQSPPLPRRSQKMQSPPLPRLQSPPLPRRSQQMQSPPLSRLQSPPLPRRSQQMQSPPLPRMPSPPPTEFQDYQCYVADVPRYPTPTPTRSRHDRGTELFLSQYYKSLEQEQDDTRSPPPV